MRATSAGFTKKGSTSAFEEELIYLMLTQYLKKNVLRGTTHTVRAGRGNAQVKENSSIPPKKRLSSCPEK